jgi:hypothetical protein
MAIPAPSSPAREREQASEMASLRSSIDSSGISKWRARVAANMRAVAT